MNCPKCGSENADTSRFCKDCGESFVQSPETEMPFQETAQPVPPVAQDSGYQPPQGSYQPPQQGYQPPQGAYQPPQGAYQQPMGGQYYNQMPPQMARPTFSTTSAIIAIIFGFLCGGWLGGIFAIVALTKGNKVDNLWAMGDYQGAVNAAAEGKKFLTISWVLSVIGFVLMILGNFLFIGSTVWSEFGGLY